MASTFPADTPSYDSFSTPITLAALQHTVRHRQMEEDIVAIATKVGENSSAVTSSHDYKINALEGDVTTLQSDKADSTDVTSDIAAAVAAVKEALYPIGTIYENYSNATNPGTLLGFGTWVALTDRFLVGKGSGTFATAGATGGAETHTLTLSEIPNATGSAGIHGSANGSMFWSPSGVFGTSPTLAGKYKDVAYVGGASTITSLDFDLGGGGGAHNNLPPYTVIYMWRRTA